MKFIRVLFVFIISVLGCISVASAQNAAIQQLQNSQAQMQMPQPQLHVGTNAPELYTGENEDIGPQYILRVNNQKVRRKLFEATLDSQVFYSDDANYAGHSGAIGSAVFVNTVQAAIAPDPFAFGPGKFGPAAGFSCQLYDYSSSAMHPLDFYAETAFVNLRYFFGNNWQFTVGGNYTRLINEGNQINRGHQIETYREWLPSVSLQRGIPINDHLAVIVGDVVDYHFTHVQSAAISRIPPLPAVFTRDDINDHLDESIFVSLNWQVTPHFVVQPFYRFQYSYYRFDALSSVPPAQHDRSDWLNSVGLNVVYSFNSVASLRLFCSYNTKSSSDSVTPAYDEFNGGIGGTLDIKF
jgi:hypothetical protein